MPTIDNSEFDPDSLFIVFTKIDKYRQRHMGILLTSEKLPNDRLLFLIGRRDKPAEDWHSYRRMTDVKNDKFFNKLFGLKIKLQSKPDGVFKGLESHTTIKLNKPPLSEEHSRSVLKKAYHPNIEYGPFEYGPLEDCLARFLTFLSQDDFNFLDKPKDMTNDEIARKLIMLADEEIEGDGRVIPLSQL